MSIQIIDQPGSISGRLGKGFAKSLSENLPKEIERARLSNGLKSLEKNKQMSPLQKTAELYGLPGGAEASTHVLPLLREQQRKEAFINKGSSLSSEAASSKTVLQPKELVPSESVISKPSTSNLVTEPNKESKTVLQSKKSPLEGGLATMQEIRESQQRYLQQPDYRQIKEKADEYLDLGITQDPSEALSMANQELTQEYNAQIKKNQVLDQELGKRFALEVGSQFGEGSKVATEIQQWALDQAKYLVHERGYTPESAATEISKVMQDMGKTYNKMRESGSYSNIIKGNKTDEIKRQFDNFKKYGQEEIFNDLASDSYGISRQKIASIINPIDKKSPVGRALAKIKKGDHKADFDRLIEAIGPDDSLLSIEESLFDKYINPNKFLKRLEEIRGREKLTTRQSHEYETPLPPTIFGDILFSIFN